MRVYRNVPVELTYQNYGSTWLCILRGAEQNIESVFNGLFNFGATNGEYQFHDGARTVAFFWSNEQAMRKFFFYQYFIPRFNVEHPIDLRVARRAKRWAKLCLARMKNRHEVFRLPTTIEINEFSIGQVKAEKPDSDFKDSVLTHAFTDKTLLTNETEILQRQRQAE